MTGSTGLAFREVEHAAILGERRSRSQGIHHSSGTAMYARLGDRCWYGMKRYPSRPRTSKMLYRFTMLELYVGGRIFPAERRCES
jgi:hypothetical protein